MAQFERYFSDTYSVSVTDPVFYNVGLPAVTADQALLITGVYFHFSAAYSNNISTLRVHNTGVDVNVFSRSTGIITADMRIIGTDSQFVMIEGDELEFVFNNSNAGTLTITVFYRLIPGQSSTNGIKFGAVRDQITTQNTNIIIPSPGCNFYKSLIIFNDDLTDYFFLKFYSKAFKKVLVTGNITTLAISSLDYLYECPDDVGALNIDTSSGSPQYSYYMSYYYDPLYTP
jgi:hypothetical protein